MNPVRCADCGFLQHARNPAIIIPEMICATRVKREDPGAKGLSCWRQVPTFSDCGHRDERKCDEFEEWRGGLSCEAHYERRERRAAEDRIARVQREQAKQLTWNIRLSLVAGVASFIAAVAAVITVVRDLL